MFGRKKKSPEKDPTSLANILLRFEWITRDQAKEALSQQHDRLVGVYMVDKGMITKEQLDEALLHQGHSRGTISDGDAGLQALEKKQVLVQKLMESVRDVTNRVADVVRATR